MSALLVAVFLLIMFAFVDVWYFVRFIIYTLHMGYRVLTQGKKVLSPEDLTKESTITGIVLPSDLDHCFHMNNSKYLREMDFGRMHTLSRQHFLIAMRKLKGTMALNAVSIRYRRSLLLWQWFQIKTRITHWEKDALYMEQRFIGSEGFVYAIALIKFAVRKTTVPEVIKVITGMAEVESPLPSPEMVSWMESIQRSSSALKKETEKEK